MTLFMTIKFNNNFKMISFSRALMLFVFIGIVCTFLTSCTDPKSIKISDDDAYEHIEELATELDSVTFQKLKSSYRTITLVHSLEPNEADAVSVVCYNKKFKSLTIGDLLRDIEKSEEKTTHK